MKGDNFPGIIIVISLIGIAILGGFKNKEDGSNFLGITPVTPQQQQNQQQANIQQEITTAQQKVEELKRQLAEEEAKKTYSKYRGLVTLANINKSNQASQEYAVIRMSGLSTTAINITGWTLKSTSTGNSISIPQGTYLYFAGTQNVEENIRLENQDTLYLITGTSPNGSSFKLNKCSGYLQQFQNFNPYLATNCPLPRNEDLSSIPRSPVNDSCLDYIDSFPSCRIQTETLPANWSYECTRFIYEKINYPSCVNTHKNDKDFYMHEWRVYLKRSEPLWKDRRENIVLYDEVGKIVDSISY